MRPPPFAFAAGLAVVLLAGCGSTIAQSPQVADGLGAAAAGAPGAAAAGLGGPNPVANAALSAPGASGGVAAAAAGAAGPGPITGSASAGTAAPGSPGSGPGTGPIIGGIPATGRGWTATEVFVGYTTQNDFNNTAAAAAGYNSIDAGSQVGDVNALVDAINKAGGIFGRKLVAIDRDNSSQQVQTDPGGTSAADCVYFTEDHPVVAVLNLESALDTEVFRSCMAKHQMPVLSLSIQPVDHTTLNLLGNYLIPLLVPTWDRLAPVLVSQLKAQGYFTGWNTATDTAAPATPVKVGLLVTNDPQGQRVAKVITSALAAVGQKPLVFQFSTTNESSDFNSAVLQFRSAGVTHVIEDDVNLAVFMIQAQSQNYRPRYGITSYNAPQPFLEGVAPPSQIVGSVGVGNAPTLDVDQNQDPGPTPGGPTCAKILADGGQTFNGHRFAQAVAYAECDGFRMLAAAAKAGGGLTGPALLSGVDRAGPAFATAFAFRSGLSATNPAFPGAGRALGYSSACSCLRYVGPEVTI